PVLGGAGAGALPRLPAAGARTPADRRARPVPARAQQRAAPQDPGLDLARGHAAPPVLAPPAGDRHRRLAGDRRRSPPPARAPAGLRRAAAGTARRALLAAVALAPAAPARMAAPVAGPPALGDRTGGGAGMERRPVGRGRAAVAGLGRGAGAAPRTLRRLAPGRAPGRGARRLVVAALALRRDRQAACPAAAPVVARPPLRHGLAVAGHGRRR